MAIFRAKANARDFPDTVEQITRLTVDSLSAEYMSVFFQNKERNTLNRWAFAVSSIWQERLSSGTRDFTFDEEYRRDSATLMWPAEDGPYAKERTEGALLNLEPSDILMLPDHIQVTVNRFRKALPSETFRHLLIAQIRHDGRVYGALRCVNHLDTVNGYELSGKPFGEDDKRLIAGIAELLASWYADHRQRVKGEALDALEDSMQVAKTEDEAFEACLKNLTSEKTGFPMGILWMAGRAGSPPFVRSEPPLIEQLASEPDEAWGQRRGFRGLHSEKIGFPDGREGKLLVFAYHKDDFGGLAKRWIDRIVNPLKRALHRIQYETLSERFASDKIIGESPAINEVKIKARRVAPTSSTVLLRGETGTGKERVAELIHELSQREGEFVALNCTAISESLLESELFGHEKGAFTGATEKKIGKFERASRGTIFLDEIGEMKPETQVKLLRVLQDHVIERVGGNQKIPVDVRVVAATHRNLEKAVEDGTFREDLYYRFKVIQIDLLPLRDRPGDIELLANYFIQQHARKQDSEISIDADAMDVLKSHQWPGNVRELENAIERAVILGDRRLIIKENLDIGRSNLGGTPATEGKWTPCEMAEKDCIARALDRANWDKGKVMDELKLSKTTLNERIKKYALSKPRPG